jgi:hypothetical protein
MDDDGSLTRVEIADEDFGDLLIADAELVGHAAERTSDPAPGTARSPCGQRERGPKSLSGRLMGS